MLKEEFKLTSEFDGLSLGVSLRAPEHEPVAIIQFAHGMAEHRRRYHDLLEYLAERGFVTAINDHRGHGESVRTKDDLGFFYENGSQAIVEDCHQLTMYLKNRYPGKKIFLLGHSMGSLVVRCYIKKYDNDLDGLIVCGSPSANPMADTGMKLLKFIKTFRGDHHRSNMMNKMSFGSYNNNIPGAATPFDWLATDTEVVAKYIADPECGYTFTVNGYRSLLELIKETYNTEGWQVNNPELPITFIAGANDPCIIDEKAFNSAVDFIKARGYANTNSVLYPGLRHEILNEIGKEEIWEELALWCEYKL